MLTKILFLLFVLQYAEGVAQGKLTTYMSWNQIRYDINGTKYTEDSNCKKSEQCQEELSDSEKYFIQYNNVPMGIAIYPKKYDLIVALPRRQNGIISTLNTVTGHKYRSPFLKPYPAPPRFEDLVSVYRPTVDRCSRMWVVDTGVLEIPGARKIVKPPSILIYDLESNNERLILKYELKPTDLVNNMTSGGLTSISVEVNPISCEDAYAYINDLATATMIVFSLKHRDSWSFSHPSFKYDPRAVNFTVAGIVVPWRDGLFSTALADFDFTGRRKLYFHALASTQEFSVYTDALKVKGNKELNIKLEGDRGPNTQSGSHAYHPGTRTLFFAGLAKDAILCWNVDKPLTPENVGVAAQDHEKLVYISNLKIVKDEVWVMVNQMPRFVYSTLNPDEDNFFVHRGKVRDLIKGTPCECRLTNLL